MANSKLLVHTVRTPLPSSFIELKLTSKIYKVYNMMICYAYIVKGVLPI